MEKIDWDSLYMTMVYLMAMKSKDLSTRVGAVVVGPYNEVRSVGFNGLPMGVDDDVPERQERPEKYHWFEHAERNAIYLSDAPVRGCKMYTNGVPCSDCARAVIQAGIVEVIVDEDWNADNREKWNAHAERSMAMFEESGVKVRFWKGELLNIHRFRSGEKFQ